jgi:hypothetical protein
MNTKTGKYWYLITIHECPLCGRGNTYRERQYSPKPEDPAQRVHYEQIFDWCEW